MPTFAARAKPTTNSSPRRGSIRTKPAFSGRAGCGAKRDVSAYPKACRPGGAVERLAQATLRAANAKQRRNDALRSNAGQTEHSKAVSVYERYKHGRHKGRT